MAEEPEGGIGTSRSKALPARAALPAREAAGASARAEGVTARLQRLMAQIGSQQEEILERYQLRVEAILARHSEDLKGSVRDLLGLNHPLQDVGDVSLADVRWSTEDAAEALQLRQRTAAYAFSAAQTPRPALPAPRFTLLASSSQAAKGGCHARRDEADDALEDLESYYGRIKAVTKAPRLDNIGSAGAGASASALGAGAGIGPDAHGESTATDFVAPCGGKNNIGDVEACRDEKATEPDTIMPRSKNDSNVPPEVHQKRATFGDRLKATLKRSSSTVSSVLPFMAHTSEDNSKNSACSGKRADESFADAMLRLRTSHDHGDLNGMVDWQLDSLRGEDVDKHRRLHFDALRDVVNGNFMQTVVCFAIVLNAVFIGVQADESLKRSIVEFDLIASGATTNVSLAPPAWHYIVDLCFLVFFTIELVMRLLAEESQFWLGPEKKWNFFDAFLVISAIMEELLRGLNLTFLRLLRMLRTIRAIRVVRVVRSFRELRLMLIAVWGSILPIFWAFVFLCVIMFLTSVILMSAVATKVQDVSGHQDLMQAALCAEDVVPGGLDGLCAQIGFVDTTKTYFHSLLYMLLSLFMSISGGMDWWEFGKPFMEIHWFYGVFFVLYIFIMTFGVLNIITGIFCEAAAEIANSDRDLVVGAEIERQHSYVNSLKELFMELDKDRSGTIGFPEFQEALREEKSQAFFATLGINATEAVMVFKLLDADNSGELSIDEFVLGCMRVKGNSTTLDMTGLMMENKVRLERMENQHEGILKGLALVLRACENGGFSVHSGVAAEKGHAVPVIS
eukprot:TRINITY_DN65184_c0_g1_i1.p1 TRINITY_DN65184_c0_g1~~TRINITY_DN65184_c0_g1_i1.p1  ORF type:complete len:814 (+),score=175.48 TRINITY_DN65184_c0_g1_i1:62-2443(+)